MSKRGRKPNAIPRVRMPVWMRVDLAADVELLVHDSVLRKARYGQKIAYFEGLVLRDLNERRRRALQPVFESELSMFIKELKQILTIMPVEVQTLIERFEVKDARPGDGGTSSESAQPEDNTSGATESSMDKSS